MVRFSSLVLILVFANLVSKAQGSIKMLEAKQGFRDAKVGMPFTAFKAMKLMKPIEFEVLLAKNSCYPIEYIKRYERASDSKKLGNASLKQIYYEFYKGKLHSITIYADAKYASSIFKTLQSAYGEGQCTRFSESSISCYWVTKNIMLHYGTDTDSDDVATLVQVSFSSVVLSNEIAKEQVRRKERAKFNKVNGL